MTARASKAEPIPKFFMALFEKKNTFAPAIG